MTAYQHIAGGPISFRELEDYIQRTLPCGKCRGCRLARSRAMATRCMHEKQMHKYNSSITLTYNNDHNPGYSLDHRDYQLFMKRLRKKALSRKYTNQNHNVGPTDLRVNSLDEAQKIKYY